MTTEEQLFTAFCPGCGTKIRFTREVEVGQFVVCAECGDELEIVRLNPVTLDWAFVDSFAEEDEYEYDDADEEYSDDDEAYFDKDDD